MANQPATYTKTGNGYTKITWGALGATDTGDGVIVGQYPWIGGSFTGTFGTSPSVQWEWSNDGGTTWVLLGTAATATNNLQQLSGDKTGQVEMIRPHATAGAGNAVVATLICMGVRG